MNTRDIRDILTSPRLSILGRPFNFLSWVRVMSSSHDSLPLIDFLRVAGINSDDPRLREIFLPVANSSDPTRLGSVGLWDALAWHKLAVLLGKEIELWRRDNFGPFAYPVAIIFPCGKYKITATTPSLVKRIINLFTRYDVEKERHIQYPPYIGGFA